MGEGQEEGEGQDSLPTLETPACRGKGVQPSLPLLCHPPCPSPSAPLGSCMWTGPPRSVCFQVVRAVAVGSSALFKIFTCK